MVNLAIGNNGVPVFLGAKLQRNTHLKIAKFIWHLPMETATSFV
jgi:hypothetical protein